MLLSLILLTLLYPSVSLSFLLTLFPCFFSCQRLELPQSSQAAQIQRKPFLGLTHTHIHKLPRQIYPLSSVLPQTSCLSPAAPRLPQMNISQGMRCINTRAVFDEKAARKHRELQKTTAIPLTPFLQLTVFSFILCHLVGFFSPFPYLELVDAVDQMQ